MTFVLHLAPEIESRLLRYAQATGKPAETIVADLIDTLPEPPVVPAPKPRIAGLHEGNILYMSDDFDDPLPDEFWDSPIFPEKKIESRPE